MARQVYVMVFDAGTGAGRCFITDLKGRRTFESYKEWTYDRPADVPGAKEFNPSEFWKILSQLARETMSKGGIDPSEIAAVTSTSQREGMVLLDKAGKEIYAGPNGDHRGTKESKAISRVLGDKIYQTSGHWPSSMFAPCRMEWLKKNKPQVFGQVAHLLMINDWILYKLSGEYRSEPTNACETALFDIHDLQWSWDVIKQLEMPSSIFSNIQFPGQQVGEISARAAEETGLREGTPVIMGASDTQCGLLGSGVIQENQIGIVAGTTTPVQMVMPRPLIDPKCRMWTDCHVTPDKWVLESNVGDSGILYQWFRDSFCQAEQAVAKSMGCSPYEIMNKESDSVEASTSHIFAFLGSEIMDVRGGGPEFGGFIMPSPGTIGNGTYEKGHFVRSVLESMAYAVRGNIEQIAELMPAKTAKVFVCGGSSSSNTWLKILCNVINIPVVVPETTEATSIGAAICAARGIGIYPDFESAIENMVHLKEPIIPNDRMAREYDSLYQQWRMLYETLRKTNVSSNC